MFVVFSHKLAFLQIVVPLLTSLRIIYVCLISYFKSIYYLISNTCNFMCTCVERGLQYICVESNSGIQQYND